MVRLSQADATGFLARLGCGANSCSRPDRLRAIPEPVLAYGEHRTVHSVAARPQQRSSKRSDRRQMARSARRNFAAVHADRVHSFHRYRIQPRGVAREKVQAEHVSPIWGDVTAEAALAVLDEHFVEQPDRLRASATRAEVSGLERWSFNPLVDKSHVALDSDLVAPAAHLVADKFTNTSLYYTGVAA